MRFKAVVLFLNIIMFLGVYTIYTGGTIASVCRSAGHGLIGISIDESGSGTIPGPRAWLSGVGRSIADTCSRRS